MFGPDILVRTLSVRTRTDRYGNQWQYHSRSDHHSKVACWGIVFDLLSRCGLLRKHVATGRVKFGINHEMRDFRNDRKKNLDLVLCMPGGKAKGSTAFSLTKMVEEYGIALNDPERSLLQTLPVLERASVGGVLLALEAKACMTAHQRALPRLYDELNSSHLTVHGASDHAIAAGFVMINQAKDYVSPDLNRSKRAGVPEWSRHDQPRDTDLVIDKVRQIPRRSKIGDGGYDALAISVIECVNDGRPVRLVNSPPAPQPGEIYHYASMIERLDHLYSTRFKELG
jgi:hypothetical protein